MNLESLFADLESVFEAERRADLAAAAHELAEAELGAVRLLERLRGACGRRVQVLLRGGTALGGLLLRVEEDLLLVQEDSGVQVLLPAAAVVAAWPLGAKAVAQEPRRGVGLRAAARALVRRGAVVRLTLLGSEVVGRPVRVGADHLDLVVDGGSPLGLGAGGRVSVALDAIDAVRSL